MAELTGREPQLSGARRERHWIYVLLDEERDPLFKHELLDIAGSLAEAQRIAEGWLNAHYPEAWERNSAIHYAAVDGRKDNLLLAIIVACDYYKEVYRDTIKAQRYRQAILRPDQWRALYEGRFPPERGETRD